MSKENDVERFWKRVQKSENCWLWSGDIGFYYDGHAGKSHIYSYKLKYGDIPPKHFVHRTCENNKCVNPDHLFITNKNNEKQKYIYDLDVFFREDAVSYYLLGVYMTDGNIWTSKTQPNTKAVRLVSSDIDWITNIKNLVCPDTKIYIKNNAAEFGIYSSKLADWFISKGCGPKKTLTIQFPTIPEKYLSDFIRGCIDGDGNIYLGHEKNKNCYSYRISLCSGSETFIKGYNNMLTNLNYSFNADKRTDNKPHMCNGKLLTQKHPYYATTIYSRKAYDFIKWIYYPSNPLSMPRKQSKANKLISTFEKYQSKNISIIDNEPY